MYWRRGDVFVCVQFVEEELTNLFDEDGDNYVCIPDASVIICKKYYDEVGTNKVHARATTQHRHQCV